MLYNVGVHFIKHVVKPGYESELVVWFFLSASVKKPLVINSMFTYKKKLFEHQKKPVKTSNKFLNS